LGGLLGFYTDISCLGGVFGKNTSRETKEKFPEPVGEENLVSRLVFLANTQKSADKLRKKIFENNGEN
jgi:hypothetical protein